MMFPASGPKTMGEFGEKFRKAREKKELSLDDVSNVTKISARMLQAIEQEHFDQLPGGVFNKGFIRAYAKHLGLDGEEAVSDYLASLRQAQIDAHEVWEPESSTPARAVPAKVRVAEAKKAASGPPSSTEAEELPELQLPRMEDARPSRNNLGQAGTGISRTVASAAILLLVLGGFLWTRHSRTSRAASPSQVQAATA